MLKSRADGLSRDWVVRRRQGSAYTGGALAMLGARYAACLCSDRVALLHLASGLVARFVASPQADAAVHLAASPDGRRLVVFHRNLMARCYDARALLRRHRLSASGEDQDREGDGDWDGDANGGEDYEATAAPAAEAAPESSDEACLLRSWRGGHRLPVTCADFDPSSTLVATGAADKSVMVWDAAQGFATHSFRGGHAELVSCVRFQPHVATVQRLVSASQDGRVCVWDLLQHACVASLAEQHFSAVTSIAFSRDAGAHFMITCGRDKVINVWDTRDFNTGAAAAALAAAAVASDRDGSAATMALASSSSLKASVAAHEALEAAIVLPEIEGEQAAAGESGGAAGSSRALCFVTVGDRGLLRKWRLVVSGALRATRTFAVSCVATRTALELRRRGGSGGLAEGVVAHAEPPSSADGAAAAAQLASKAELPLSQQFEHVLLRCLPRARSASLFSASSSPSSALPSASLKRTRVVETIYDGFGLVCVTRDQVLSLVRICDLRPSKVICGFSDQITDVRYLPAPPGQLRGRSSLLAVATNSEQLRLVDSRSFDTVLCDGHVDVILALSPSPDGALVATASKDRSVRIWDVATGTCVALCEGHTEAVSAVSFTSKSAAFMRRASDSDVAGAGAAGATSWLASAGKDRTLKLWQLAPLLSQLPSPRPAGWDAAQLAACLRRARGGSAAAAPASFEPYIARTLAAVVAHDKDINCVAVAPNDRLVASASQDRTIKLWAVPALAQLPVATLRGHRRGVWAVAFSPADQVLASASGDGTLRLWACSAATGYACLRTFEGHDASVLCVRFLRRGLQLVSAGADGLVKLWSVKEAECLGTFDAHADKVWALAVRPAEFNDAGAGVDADVGVVAGAEDELELVTGGGDSVLNVWRDVTAATAAGEVEAAEEAVRKQQHLLGAMARRDYARTLALTLELDQPGRCSDVLQELLETGPSPPPPASAAEADRRIADAVLAELRDMDDEAQGLGLSASLASSASSSPASIAGMHPAGAALAATLFAGLPGPRLATLLRYVVEWASQARHGLLAQRVLYIVLRAVPRTTLLARLAEAKRRRGIGDDQGGEEDGAASSESVGGGAVKMRMIAGVGAARVVRAPSALDDEANLTPVAVPVASLADRSGAGERSLSGPQPLSVAAAGDLRGLVASLLPYAERHLERLDRLLVSTHLADATLIAMRALEPQHQQQGQGEDDGAALAGIGIGARASATVAALDNDDDDAAADASAAEWAAGGSGAGWLSSAARTSAPRVQKPGTRAPMQHSAAFGPRSGMQPEALTRGSELDADALASQEAHPMVVELAPGVVPVGGGSGTERRRKRRQRH